jgi:hypothetical protein
MTHLRRWRRTAYTLVMLGAFVAGGLSDSWWAR